MGGQKLTQGWLSTTIEIGLAAARLNRNNLFGIVIKRRIITPNPMAYKLQSFLE
jgi:hypothetical protein